MSELMVKVEDVYKEYRLGAIGGTTLRDEIKRKTAKMMHKEDFLFASLPRWTRYVLHGHFHVQSFLEGTRYSYRLMPMH